MPDNGKTLIFVDTRTLTPAAIFNIRKAVTEGSPRKAQVVYFGSKMPPIDDAEGMNIRLSEDYLNKEDHEAIDAYVTNLIRTWYLGGVTNSGGIDLGQFVEFDFLSFLTFRIKNLTIMKKALESETYARIVAIENTGELIGPAAVLAARHGIEMAAINLRSWSECFRDIASSVRDRLSDMLYFSLIDPLVNTFLSGRLPEDPILIDTRAHALLTGPHNIERIAFFCIEKGISNRKYALKRKGAYVSFDTPLRGKAAEDVTIQVKELRDKWACFKNESSLRSRFTYEGINIWPVVEGKLSSFFEERFSRVLGIIRQVEKFHRRKKIKTIVFRADGREKEKAIIAAAGAMNIPTIYVTHGILAENNGHDKLYCTRTAVWGQADFDRYVSLGNPPSKLAVTGSPKYDRLLKETAFIPAAQVYQTIGLTPGKEYVVLATQPVRKFSSFNTYEEMKEIVECAIRAMSQVPGMQLVIKLHPFDEYSMYEKIFKDTRQKGVFLIRDVDNLSLLKWSSLLLAHNSTAALEAMMLDKPVVIVNLGKRDDTVPYVSNGGALGVYNAVGLASAINEALVDPAIKERLEQGRRQMVSRYLYKQDGLASQRVAELINSMGCQ